MAIKSTGATPSAFSLDLVTFGMT